MKKKYKIKPSVKLMHPNYPIGWGTGLDEDEWREYADNYIPMKDRGEKGEKDEQN